MEATLSLFDLQLFPSLKISDQPKICRIVFHSQSSRGRRANNAAVDDRTLLGSTAATQLQVRQLRSQLKVTALPVLVLRIHGTAGSC